MNIEIFKSTRSDKNAIANLKKIGILEFKNTVVVNTRNLVNGFKSKIHTGQEKTSKLEDRSEEFI